jgi:hypothetical protein
MRASDGAAAAAATSGKGSSKAAASAGAEVADLNAASIDRLTGADLLALLDPDFEAEAAEAKLARKQD